MAATVQPCAFAGHRVVARRDVTVARLREIFDRFGSVDATQVRADSGAYVVCISYWDIQNLIDLEPAGGTYIYSSSEAYSEDQAIDQERLLNWLRYFELEPVGGLPGAEKGPFHASGHADGPSLEALISDIDAAKILPVHTENLEWFEQRWPEKLVVAQDRSPVWLP